MSMRLFYFVCCCGAGLVLPWWIFIGCALWYGFLYGGEELLGIGFALDMLYGHSVPWLPVPLVYSCALFGMLIFLWGIRPLLSYNNDR